MGLGTQDNLDQARDFVSDTGISSFQMLWDETFDSWAELGVASQPAWALFSPAGEFAEGSLGGVPIGSVLEKAASL